MLSFRSRRRTSSMEEVHQVSQKFIFRWSYAVPLCVYLAFGGSALASIAGTFIVKEHLTISASELARIWFWAMVPWILKIPLAAIVDYLWRWRFMLLITGALCVLGSLTILLLLATASMSLHVGKSGHSLYLLSVVLGSAGYVIQDVIADGLTVEAVPTSALQGCSLQKHSADERRREQLHLQTLARTAGVLGMALVAATQLLVPQFGDSSASLVWALVCALTLSLVTIGCATVAELCRTQTPRLKREPFDRVSRRLVELGLLYGAIVTLGAALPLGWKEEVVFLLSVGMCVLFIRSIYRELSSQQRTVLFTTLLVFSATGLAPFPGEVVRWWQIDTFGFDQHFFGLLTLVGVAATILGLGWASFTLQRGRLEPHRAVQVAWWCTVVSAAGFAPLLLLAHLHPSALANIQLLGVAGSTINVLSAPLLLQLATLPAIAVLASEMPHTRKATYFAVLATVASTAGSGSQLVSSYLLQVWPIARGDYQHLGSLLLCSTTLALALVSAAVVYSKIHSTRQR